MINGVYYRRGRLTYMLDRRRSGDNDGGKMVFTKRKRTQNAASPFLRGAPGGPRGRAVRRFPEEETSDVSGG